MAYNGGFPVNYQPYYPMQPQMQTPAPQQNNSLIWVSGEAGAKAYLVAPNTTVQLWDSEAPTIYLKSADTSGMPSIKILDYTIREQAQAQKPPVADAKKDYVTHAELVEFEDKITQKLADIKGDLGA
jgi:hypothetical protein